jgi:hypothetical protein
MVEHIKYMVLSDIHMGHQNNLTINIAYNLIEYLESNLLEFKKCDILFIDGDTTDRILSNNSPEYKIVTKTMVKIGSMCVKHNVKLRLLEGTPSHDWNQLRILEGVFEESGLDIDFKYIENLSIEYMEDLDVNILYLPDEHKHKASETWKDIKKLMIKNKLTKVDMIHLHGQFHYQLPMVKTETSHTEEDFLSICDNYIHAGHIHIPSVYDRILIPGSFDRLKHGEEEDKGGLVVDLYRDKENKFKFIKNEKAMIFKTLSVLDLDKETAIKFILERLKEIPYGSFVRIEHPSNETIYTDKEFKEKYLSKYKVSYKTEKEKDTKETEIIDMSEDLVIDSFKITPENIEVIVC